MKANYGYSIQTRVSKFQKNVIRCALDNFHTIHNHYETDKVSNNDDNCYTDYDYEKQCKKNTNLIFYEKLQQSISDLQKEISQKTDEIEKYTHNISIINNNIKNGYINNVDSRNLHIFTSKFNTLQSQLIHLNNELNKKIEEKNFIDYIPINIDRLYYQISIKKQQLYSLKNKEKLHGKKKTDNETNERIKQIMNEINVLNTQINESINKNKVGKLNKKYYHILLENINKYKELQYFKKHTFDEYQIFYLFCNNFTNLNSDEYYFYVKNNSKFLDLKNKYKTTNLSTITNIMIKNNKYDNINEDSDDDSDEW